MSEDAKQVVAPFQEILDAALAVNVIPGIEGVAVDLYENLTLRTPKQGFRHAIETWEGGFQAMPEDIGNWIAGKLIGTNKGVTPAALAQFRGIAPTSITKKDMQALKLSEAIEIGLQNYYMAPRFHILPYVPVTEIAVDIGWGSGPRMAIKFLQRIIQVADDGVIGPITQKAYIEWIRDQGHGNACETLTKARIAFYRKIVEVRPTNRKFLRGWLNRANHYRVGGEWWKLWDGRSLH